MLRSHPLCSPPPRVFLLPHLPAAPGIVCRDSALKPPRGRALSLAGCGLALSLMRGRGAGHGSRRSGRLLLQALLPALACAAAKVSDSASQNGNGMCGAGGGHGPAGHTGPSRREAAREEAPSRSSCGNKGCGEPGSPGAYHNAVNSGTGQARLSLIHI